jgi:hypothetical protein
MHTYRLLTDPAEITAILVPVLESNGSEVPPAGCYVAAVEFDDAGEVLAYQLLQNALFLEGLWSRDKSAHLLTLHNMASRYAVDTLGAQRLLTMTRQDEQGSRIAHLARKLGFEQLQWNIFRRKTKCPS